MAVRLQASAPGSGRFVGSWKCFFSFVAEASLVLAQTGFALNLPTGKLPCSLSHCQKKATFCLEALWVCPHGQFACARAIGLQ